MLQVHLGKILHLRIELEAEVFAVDRAATRFLKFSFKDSWVTSCMNIPIYLWWKNEKLSQTCCNSKLPF